MGEVVRVQRPACMSPDRCPAQTEPHSPHRLFCAITALLPDRRRAYKSLQVTLDLDPQVVMPHTRMLCIMPTFTAPDAVFVGPRHGMEKCSAEPLRMGQDVSSDSMVSSFLH